MTKPKPTGSVGRLGRGLALADALLRSNRRFQPLSAAAHERVKRRLRTDIFDCSVQRTRWLRPIVVAGSLLICGTSFGIAVNQLVVRRIWPESPQRASIAAPDSRRKARNRPARQVVVPGEQASSAAGNDPQEVAAPAMESVLPSPGKAETTPPPLKESGQRRTSHRADPVVRSAPTPIGPLEPPPIVASPVKVSMLNREHPSAGNSPVRTAVSPPVPSVPVPGTTLEPPPIIASPVKVSMLDREHPSAGNSPVRTAVSPLVPSVPTPGTTAISAPAVPPAEKASDPDGLTEEQLLVVAVRALRAQHDPSPALAALDDYRTRYPQGRLSTEASILRVDALTALDRQPEALRILDGLDLSHVPGGVQRRLQRGEMRAASGHFLEALGDFDWVLAHSRQSRFIERAM